MSKQDIEQSVMDAAASLDGLIPQQGVSPVSNVDELSDLWPGNDDPDDLMRYVLEERPERRRLPIQRDQVP